MKYLLPLIRRSLSTRIKTVPKISVIGSGPAGFYAAQYLLKKLQLCEIDIYERLPVPFGLVRYGVAPDHPEVKNVENTFTKVAQQHNVRFLGNVTFGKHITLNELLSAYHIVILAYGADENKSLGIPGENLKNIIPARRIVGWYNGVPSDKDIAVNLDSEEVAIFGQGNVAIDVARILLTPVDELKKTDITQHSLEVLSKSKIKTVYLIGRRGPLQAAYTIKELREMLKLKNCSTEWNTEDFQGIPEIVSKLPRPKKRISELMLKSLSDRNTVSQINKFKPIFFRSPLEFIGKDSINKVKLGINKLEGEEILNQRAILTDSHETIDCNLGIISIGYKSIQADPHLEFDFKSGVIKNNFGKISRGLYATGWVATGPMGVILTTMNNSFSLAESILQDIQKDPTLIQDSRPGYDYVKNILDNSNTQVVTWDDWKKIDNFEISEGQKNSKCREKITDINTMLRIAAS